MLLLHVSTVWISGSSSVLLLRRLLLLRYGGPIVAILWILLVRLLAWVLLLVKAILNLWSLLLVWCLHSPVACSGYSLQTHLHGIRTIPKLTFIIVLITKRGCSTCQSLRFLNLWACRSRHRGSLPVHSRSKASAGLYLLLPWFGTWPKPVPWTLSAHLRVCSSAGIESHSRTCCRSPRVSLELPI